MNFFNHKYDLDNWRTDSDNLEFGIGQGVSNILYETVPLTFNFISTDLDLDYIALIVLYVVYTLLVGTYLLLEWIVPWTDSGIHTGWTFG